MSEDRQTIADQVAAIEPMDEIEREYQDEIVTWLANEKYVYRLQKPDVPAKHLVANFVAVDPATKKVLLVDHRQAKQWLPAGGHVELKEDPRDAVQRECQEELGIPAVLLTKNPLFISERITNDDPGQHTDVSLWYLVKLSEQTSLKWSQDEFFAVEWWQTQEILSAPPKQFYPHLPRFIRKLRRTWHETF